MYYENYTPPADRSYVNPADARFVGRVSAIKIPVDSNAGDAFSNMRKHGADGTIAQAYGCSALTDWLGEGNYQSEMLTAARANGSVKPEKISKAQQKVFDTGHDYEKSIAVHNCRIMEINSGIKVIPHDASMDEYRNSAWPSLAAHLDFIVEVVGGKIIPNPAYVIGGPEKNYLIVPDTESHFYVGDSKSVQSNFGTNWSEKDDTGLPIGGMRWGIAPTHYRQQMLGYMAACHLDGAILFAACGFQDYEHAQVFIPYDKDEAEAILDEVERKNWAALHGMIPSVSDCVDVEKAISELPLMYPDVNKNKKIHALDPAVWKKTFDRIDRIDLEKGDLESQLKPLKEEFKQKVADETGMEISSFSVSTKQLDKLKKERSDLLMEPLEEVQDGPGCSYVDEDGVLHTIEYSSGIKWDKYSKAAVEEDYPELAEDLRQRFPERKPTYSVPREKTKKPKAK